LLTNRSCNVKPCPVDGQMDAWEEWSQCSRACGGGTRTRHRSVLRQAAYGGTPTAETMQEQLCNAEACDQDCGLADWSAWGECSKMCGTGHETRVRQVLHPPLGEGTCPDETDAKRTGTRPCNTQACQTAPPLQCSSSLDLAFVFDSSGSMGSPGFERLREFAMGVVGRIQLDGEAADAATVGVVTFGSTAAVATPLTQLRATITGALSSMLWSRSDTNTAEGLSLARQMLDEHGRQGVQPVAVLVTDGMPRSASLVSTEVQRLKDQGARVFFVVVGPGMSEHIAERWVSFPTQENILMVQDFASLDEAKVTDLLASLCADMV